MRYFYDCEFIENGSTIDLISIGVVAEDGREYYAISTEFKPKKANDWVKRNVLVHLPPRNPNPAYESPRICHEARAWKKRAQIKADLLEFCDPRRDGPIAFWGYYSSYDHVALCQIFGTMMDLPKGWPMLTYDLRQLLDWLGHQSVTQPDDAPHHALTDARWIAETFKRYAI
jgi:3'-5' exoribonuclease-like protein